MPAVRGVRLKRLVDAIEAYADERWREGYECAESNKDDPCWIGTLSGESMNRRARLMRLLTE